LIIGKREKARGKSEENVALITVNTINPREPPTQLKRFIAINRLT
jgi:hypothetical protein